MEFLADRERKISLAELNTTQLLAHATQQARQYKYDDFLIVDVDAHHYENESFDEMLPFMENDVLRHLSLASRLKGARAHILPPQIGTQEMGGRINRSRMRSEEKTDPGKVRDAQIAYRWMDAMGVDYSCLFPTPLLNIGMHPQQDMETDLCWAYSRWLTEMVLPAGAGRMYSMLPLPFGDPAACLRHVETFGDRKNVTGFMVTTVRNQGVYDNAYMPVYRAMEERGLALAFHSGPNWAEPVFKSCNRFISVHALTFPFYNILHLTNWVMNGLCERFQKLPVIWIEAGLAWLPFLMQRLDHEFMLRSCEAPALKKKPSDYMREMFYASQPMELQDMEATECTFRMIKAETQLLYSSDYPHWDFDLPSTIYTLPFLSEKAKHNILGGNAARLFKLPPRNDKQKENLARFGNLAA